MSQRVVIVGAGVCGLTLASHLVRAGIKVTLLEKDSTVGGLARGFHYGDYSFDIGPHRFYSPIKRVTDFIDEVLGPETSTISRTSAVHFLGQVHTWPLRLRTLFQLPPTVSVRAFFDLLKKRRDVEADNPSFENYILGKYGRTLYQLFFKEYTEKFLGIPAASTHSDWAKIGVERATIDEKVNTASIGHLLRMMLMPPPRELDFVYPPGGVHVFCDRLRTQLLEQGAEIRTGVVPTAILSADGEIKKVVTTDGAVDTGFLVWTAPLYQLCSMLGVPDPKLEYLALLLFNTTTKVPTRHAVQWCYYGAQDVIFSRISYPAQFHPHMVPTGRGSLCVEVTCRMGDERWNDPERLAPAVRRDLARVKAVGSEEEIDAVHIEHIDHAYPVYDVAYRDKIHATTTRLEAWRNLSLGGRTGLFWYNNMDHSMSNAFDISRKVLSAMLESQQENAPAGVRRVLEELSTEGVQEARVAVVPPA